MDAHHLSNFLSFSMSPLEILIRGTIMYWCLFLLLRFLLRRDTGSAGISGILFVVLLGDAAQNAMIGNGNTVADGVLVAGSSLMVWSSFRLVRAAVARGISVVAVNRGRTRADDLFAFKLEGECGAVLRQVMDGMR